MGRGQGADDVHMDVRKGFIGHRDILDCRLVMVMNLVALALLTLTLPSRNVLLHPVSHGMLTDELLTGADPRMREAV